MNPTKIDIPQEKRAQLCSLLNARLADLIDLGTHAKQAHWNVKGPMFIALHELFDEFAGVLPDHIDTVAERLVTLGGTAHGSARQVAKASTLADYPAEIKSGKDHCEALTNSIATVGKLVRESIDKADDLGDADAADIFTALSRDLDKYLWFIESHIQCEKI